MPQFSPTLIAVDVGNSRLKLGRFDRMTPSRELPAPTATMELPLTSQAGNFDSQQFIQWCETQLTGNADWLISSVHRGATDELVTVATELGARLSRIWTVRQVTVANFPLVVEVDAPERVGMDRLMGAVAADRLRPADRAAIVVDLGTAIKVDLLSDVGAFVGGGILPGMAMSAWALQQQTDALPRVAVDHWHQPPRPLGKSTVPAIESGIFWGAVGAIRELVSQLTKLLAEPPAVFVTGGGSQLVAEVLGEDKSLALRHVPHLVLSGVAIVDAAGK
jgi:type III pantothenate kinase